MKDFHAIRIQTWNQFLRIKAKLGDQWIYRGQPKDLPLATSFERACNKFEIPLNERYAIERELITDFCRRYDGDNRELVNEDTLYCLALMQHHGAPTRLLDWTYSPFVASYFALESEDNSSVVWCINQKWCSQAARIIVGNKLIKERNNYKTRNNASFAKLYMSTKPKSLVFLENPFLFNQRLNIQQGVFLCPGDIGTSLEENIRALPNWNSDDSIIKIQFEFNNKKRANERIIALKELHRMNIHRASLFPGLDGFAVSLAYRLWMYQLTIDAKHNW